MLLFLISVGLSVTLGLMNFVNLAHGAFAMLGGYVCVMLLNALGVPFLAALPIVVVVGAGVGVVLERTLYRRLYGASTSTRCCSRSASCSCRSRTAHYFFGAAAAAGAAAGRSCAARSTCRASTSASTGCS